MKIIITTMAMAAICLSLNPAPAGLMYNGRSQCGDCCAADACASECCRYKCVGECVTVTEKKHSWETECVPVCIPPVRLPCCKCLLKGMWRKSKCCGGCTDGGCTDGCCDTGCQQKSCCRSSVLQRVFSKCAGCRVRCVNVLRKHEYKCEKQGIEWKVGCCADGCGDAGYRVGSSCCAP